jgi:hypothetical protein
MARVQHDGPNERWDSTKGGELLVGRAQGRGDRDLAAQARIVGLEFEHLDDLRVRHEPREVAVVGVGLRARLASARASLVGERDAEGATLAWIELVHLTAHALRRPPALERAPVEQCPVHRRGRRVDVPRRFGAAHLPALLELQRTRQADRR